MRTSMNHKMYGLKWNVLRQLVLKIFEIATSQSLQRYWYCDLSGEREHYSFKCRKALTRANTEVTARGAARLVGGYSNLPPAAYVVRTRCSSYPFWARGSKLSDVTFPDRWIGRGTPAALSPRSPDL